MINVVLIFLLITFDVVHIYDRDKCGEVSMFHNVNNGYQLTEKLKKKKNKENTYYLTL